MNPLNALANHAPSKVRPTGLQGRHLQMQIFRPYAFCFGMHNIFCYLSAGLGLCGILGNATTSTSRAICKACGTQSTLVLLPELCQRRQYLFASLLLFFRCTGAMLTMFQSIQRITEWRGMFGSGAVAALKNIWASMHIVTATGQRKYATHMLSKGLPFTWQSFSSKQKVCRLISNLVTLIMLPSPRPWDFPPSIDGDISRADDPMELDDPE
jgi:hypothetical protein